MKSNFYIEQKHGSQFYQILQYITDPVLQPKVKFYTGERIHPEFWHKDQRGKGKMYSSLNDYLQSLALKADAVRLKLKGEGRYTRENFIKEFKPEKRIKTGLYDRFDEWILFCEGKESDVTDKELSKRTIQIYMVLKTVLQDYEKTRGLKLVPADFTKGFYRDFKKYVLEERINDKRPADRISTNTFAGYIKNLKNFLGWLSDLDKTVSPDYTKYKVRFTKSDDKPFKDEELQWLYGQDLYKYSYVKKIWSSVKQDPKHNGVHKGNIRKKIEALERGRLVLLLLCCTGKRISDYQKMERTEIDGDIIKFLTQKTHLVCYVPYFDDIYFRPRYIIEEMNKKFGGLPKVSDQNLRLAITELCSIIGFDRFDVNTKTGRKTFATVKLLKGVPKAIIMKSTGHKSEKSFDSYVEIDQFDVVKENREKATYVQAQAS
jgi:hypothetical protein